MGQHGMWLGVCLALMVACGCGDGEVGNSGRVIANFAADTGVTQVTLTDIGINVVDSIPDPDFYYRRDHIGGWVEWRYSGTDYRTHLSIDGESGERGEEGVLPAGTLGCDTCSPLIKTKGDSGEDRNHTLLFAGSRVFHFRKISELKGS